MFEKYINYCNEMEAKRDAARKADREAHPIMYKIVDIVSIIMVIIGAIVVVADAIRLIEEKANQIKCIINNVKANAKFDRDRYEPIDEPADDTDNSYEA